jgi:alternate signal-mediated exported protein
MNKLTKAAIAGGVGIALLLGGAGTLATWNSSTGITGGTIVAGNLLVADLGPVGTWTANGVALTPLQFSGFSAVPGDVLVLTKTMKITASGNNLVASLSLAPGSIAGTTPGVAADSALATYLTKTAILTASGAGITGTGPYTVTPSTAGVAQNVTVTVTISFPRNGAAGFAAEDATKTGSVVLSGLAVTLTQS